jgi:DNA replicative helicase MCM subunit Mcm2 (Cdc46/Mcm family)
VLISHGRDPAGEVARVVRELGSVALVGALPSDVAESAPRNLPQEVVAQRLRPVALDELVQLDVTFDGELERISDLMEAAFVCTTGHVTRIHQPGRRRRDIGHCPECGDPVYLEERESLFAEIQRVPVSGEGFDTITAILGGRLWTDLSIDEGDTAVVNGIPRADFREDSTHGSAYLDILHLEVEEDLPF